MSVSRHHAEWLALVESSGPFLSLPVLMQVFPQGLDPRDPKQAKQLRLVYEEWQENPNLAGKQRAWIVHVLTRVLLYPEELLAEGQALPPGLTANMTEYGETLRPDFALLGPAGNELAGKPQLLISIYAHEQSLDKPVTGKHWKAIPATRMMELLHSANVPLGLVTNGERWMLVFAPRGETTGFTSWLASLWIDDPITLRAFHSLLSTRRFFGVKPSDTLSALFQESSKDQQEVTNQLGDQVRDAVEVLIQAFDRLDQDSGRTLLKGLDEKSLYDAALTVMMRLVFLFSAEERGLLHLGERIYDDNYAVSTLREQLQEVADRYGEEVLERRNDAWARLLATFRAVHAGVSHQDLMLPAYGGSLFDPDRYPFLEGRAQGTGWKTSAAAPLEINNRVALHLLKSLQMLQVKVPGGGPAEARRVSFVALDIEQIGHIYEGLLDHTAVRATDVVLGLAASRKKPVASMTLSELEKLQQQDTKKLIEALEEETDRSAKTLAKVLDTEIQTEEFHKVLVACAQDHKLAERVLPFRGLLRQDSFERLVIVLAGGLYVGHGNARRSTGTHYTPRSLTEPIVQHTLEPLVYRGPAEGLPKEQWRLRSPKEILDLKVCDMAMGSGAFLVQACRYLSERLVEAWENLEKEHPGEVLITPEGGFSQGEPSERLIPGEAAERLAIARRLVADRCLYGVDINPMAVEMAKLSIWLITVDKSRPFTFLDHALKCGDSLLGICRFKQLETFSLDDGRAKQVVILSNYDALIHTAIAKRREIEMMPSNGADQIAAKKVLLDQTEELLQQLKLAADLLIAAELTEGKDQKKELARAAAHMRVTQYIQKPVNEFLRFANGELQRRRTFHWPLEFPEVFARGGFDSFIGNPPYLGGKKISGEFGVCYRVYLVEIISGNAKGHADLSAYFLLRAETLVNNKSIIGFLLSSSIAEGDTREVALDPLLSRHCSLIRAIGSQMWPGVASVTVSLLWVRCGDWNGKYFLNDSQVSGITSFLTEVTGSAPKPCRLVSSKLLAFIGSYPLGEGFVLDTHEAKRLIDKDSKNGQVLFPYLIGKDLNISPTHSPAKWIINFFDWPLDRKSCPDMYEGPVAADFPDCLEIVRQRVKPERDKLGEKSDASARGYARLWWQYGRKAIELYSRIKNKQTVLAIATAATKYVAFGIVGTNIVFSHSLSIIADSTFGLFAVLSSNVHEAWARTYSSYNLSLLRYTPTDCFETFPLPALSSLHEIGLQFSEHRKKAMLSRQEGLTDIYNALHAQTNHAVDVVALREAQKEMDQAVAAAYGWSDLDLGHAFRKTKQGERYTLSESARSTLLSRLLALNHHRYEEELQAGLHQKNANARSRGRASRQRKTENKNAQGRLY